MTGQRGGEWSRGDWMQTYTGRAFWPLDARPDDVDPLDVAHALSMLCRYGGHTRRFYSVAEHCVLMSYAVAPEHALWALLHDAAEAYMVDLPRPIKRQFPEYSTAEDRLLKVIWRRFGLVTANEYLCGWPQPSEVKVADNRILLDERAALLAPSERPWTSLAGYEPLGVEIHAWDPRLAEIAYLDRLGELTREVAS